MGEAFFETGEVFIRRARRLGGGERVYEMGEVSVKWPRGL